MNRYDKFTLDELKELKCGLGWSCSEGCEIDTQLNNALEDQIWAEIKIRQIENTLSDADKA